MSDEELLRRAADDLEDAAELVGREGNFSAAKDYLDTAQRIRESLGRQPKDGRIDAALQEK